MRMRRRSKADEVVEETDETQGGEGAQDGEETTDPRANGPWDASEVELDEEDRGRVHLGALAIAGRPGVEVRLQADQESGQVQSVMLVAEDGAMELRAFAAPRHESIWDDIRERLTAEATRRGGRAAEVEGPYGTAVQMVLPVVAPDGTKGSQTSTVIGISGPRWLLRVSTFGRPALTWDPQGTLEQVLRDVVVVRGTEARSPGDQLPLTLPPSARRAPAS